MASSSLIKEQPNIFKRIQKPRTSSFKAVHGALKKVIQITPAPYGSLKPFKNWFYHLQLVIKNVNEVSCSLKKLLHLRLLYLCSCFSSLEAKIAYHWWENPSLYLRDSLELMTYLLFLSLGACMIGQREKGHFPSIHSPWWGQSVNHVVKCTKYSRELHFAFYGNNKRSFQRRRIATSAQNTF